MPGVLRVGLTGGIGAGKSTVAHRLGELGATVVDADHLARQVVEPGTEGLAAVVAAFGPAMLTAQGRLDRAAMAQRVFADEPARLLLEAIVHPRLAAATGAAFAEAAGRPQAAGGTAGVVVVHDMPLLVEKQMSPEYHLVIVVAAAVELRLRRLAERGMSGTDARARMAVQADDDARRRAADAWIDNDGDASLLRHHVDHLWTSRIAPFRANLSAERCAVAPDQVPPGQPSDGAERARLLLRVRRACPAPDVGWWDAQGRLQVRLGAGSSSARAASTALTEAGFPAPIPGLHGNADPGAPLRLELTSP